MQTGVSSPKLEVVYGAGIEGLITRCEDARHLKDILVCLLTNLKASLVQRARPEHVEVKLNNKVIISQKVGVLDLSIIKPVVLTANNKLEVLVKGSKKSFITLRVRGEKVNRPPVPVITISQALKTAPSRAMFDGSGSTDPDGHALTYSWDFGDGSVGTGALVTHEFMNAGSYTVRLTVTDSLGLSAVQTAAVQVEAPTVVPDPAQTAPELNLAVSNAFSTQIKFLYEGPNPTQLGVTPGALDEIRLGHIRGRVLNELNQPLAGAKVQVLGNTAAGHTFSREDGSFDLVVNGGRDLTVRFERSGYFEAQRLIEVTGNIALNLPDVVMIRPDTQVTQVSLGSSQTQVHRASQVQDGDGPRTATLIFPSGIAAEIVMPNGTVVQTSSLNVRSSEYTVGDNGPRRMPAALPPHTAYTYAMELSSDEAIAMGAKSVRFSKPVSFYIENFLNFPTGTAVPVGSYDTSKGAWIPETDGVILQILSEQGGVAVVDIWGTGQPASAQDLAALGMGQEELARLAELYQPGQSLWRVQVNHFSTYDCNFLGLLPPFDLAADDPRIEPPDNDSCLLTGCEIDYSRGTITEKLHLPGISSALHYASERQSGYRGAYTYRMKLIGSLIPPDLDRLEVETQVAGHVFNTSLTPLPNLGFEFTDWDGTDVFGRLLTAPTKARITVRSFLFELYQVCSAVAIGNSSWRSPPVSTCVTQRSRQATRVVERSYEFVLGNSSAPRSQGVGGWSLSEHHFFDPASERLYLGNGQVVTPRQSAFKVVEVIAGTGVQGPTGDGGPATAALLRGPRGLAVAPNGNIFVVDGCCIIRVVGRDGMIRRFAGTGQSGFSGDGGPATNALFNSIGRPSFTSDGRLVFADLGNHVIRTIDTLGIVRTIAGTPGQSGYSGDGGPANQALLNSPGSTIVARDGTIYFTDDGNHVLRKIDPSGVISRVAGTGIPGYSGDGGPALNAQFRNPTFCIEGSDGTIYIADRGNHIVRAVTADGTVTTIVGTALTGGYSGDGGPAKSARLNGPHDLALDKKGNLFVVDRGNDVVRRINPQGVIDTEIGGGTSSALSGLVSPRDVQLKFPVNISYHPLKESVIVTDHDNFVVRQYRDLWQSDASELRIGSQDGSEIYHFDRTGLHLTTKSSLTNATLFQFEYNAAQQLIAIRDSYGATTRIERDSAGRPVQIVGPDGHTHRTELNGNDLSAVVGPEGERTEMSYHPGGMLATFKIASGPVNEFEYDIRGRLTRDTNSAGGFWSLAYSLLEGDMVVDVTDSFNRRKQFRERDNVQGFTNYEFRDLGTFGSPAAIFFREKADEQLTLVESGAIFQKAFKPDPFLPGTFASSISVFNLSHDSEIQESRAVQFSGADFIYDRDLESANGRRERIRYTSSTKTLSSVTQGGERWLTQMDEFQKPVQIQVGNFSPIVFEYDSRGRMIRSAQLDREILFGYGAAGDLETVTDAMGRTTRLSYDRSNRLTETTLADTRRMSYSYSPTGQVETLMLPNNVIHRLVYGVFDFMSAYVGPAAGSSNGGINYVYNRERQLTSVSRADGRVLQYNYEPTLDRLISAGEEGSGFNLIYGGGGQVGSLNSTDLVTITKGILASDPKPFQRRYSGRVDATVGARYFDLQKNLFASQEINGQSVPFAYNGDERLVRAGDLIIGHAPATSLITNLNLSSAGTVFSYSNFGELAESESLYSGASIFKQTFTRDKLGRISRKVETIQGVTDTYDYVYDLTGRLIGVSKNGTPISSYGYDANNNRTTAMIGGQNFSATYDAQDRIVSYGSSTFQFSSHGDLQSKATGGGTARYFYDIFGQLKRAEVSPGMVVDYLTDAEQHRVQVMVNGIVTRKFVYNELGQLIGELDSNNSLVSQFVYASQSHSPDFMIRGSQGFFFVKDQLGSIRMVINTSSGNVAQRLDYDEFGRVLLNSAPNFQPLGFAAGLYDHNTGLVRFGARDYDPEIGRWTSKDPILFEGGDTNLYGYVSSDPVNSFDPAGKAPGMPMIDPDGGTVDGPACGDKRKKCTAADIMKCALTILPATASEGLFLIGCASLRAPALVNQCVRAVGLASSPAVGGAIYACIKTCGEN